MTFMFWLFIYFLISYVIQEYTFKEYVEGRENIPDNEVVNLQLQIWLWPIILPLEIACIIYFFCAFMFYSIEYGFERFIDFLKGRNSPYPPWR